MEVLTKMGFTKLESNESILRTLRSPQNIRRYASGMMQILYQQTTFLLDPTPFIIETRFHQDFVSLIYVPLSKYRNLIIKHNL